MFTDIEGSTRLWQTAPDAMRGALARHDEIVRSAVESHGGYVFSTGGDGFGVAFARAGDAVAAAAARPGGPGGGAVAAGAPLLGCGWGCTPARRRNGAGTISAPR